MLSQYVCDVENCFMLFMYFPDDAWKFFMFFPIFVFMILKLVTYLDFLCASQLLKSLQISLEFYLSFSITGLRILAFPCNQFNNQEPGNSEEIQCFLKDRKVKFDLFEKIDVNGKDAHPLYKYLKKEQGGMVFDAIKWNFTKFVVDKEGKPVGRHSPNTSPKEMLKDVEKYF